MMTNLFKKQRKQSPLAVVALLSVLVGAQVGAFAFVDPVSTGSPFQYGFNSGADAYLLFGTNTTAASAFIVGRCTGHYSSGGDVASCESGATAGYKAKGSGGGGGGINS